MRIWSVESWRSPAIPKSNFEIDDVKNRGTNWLTSAKHCVYLLSLQEGTNDMNDSLNLKPGVPSACNLSDGVKCILRMAQMEAQEQTLSRLKEPTLSAVMVEASTVMRYINDNMDVLKDSMTNEESIILGASVRLLYEALRLDDSLDEKEKWNSEGEVK